MLLQVKKFTRITLHKCNLMLKFNQGVGKIKTRFIISSIIALSLTGLPSMAYMTPEVNALYQQACSAEYQNDLPTAVEKLKQAISLSQKDSLLYTKLAGIYTELGAYDRALDAYSKVIELKPDDAFVYISVGSIYETQGKYNEALAAYNKATEIFPEYKYNYLNIANVKYQMQDYKSASETYDKFLNIYPQHREARENIAAAYLMQNLPDKAVNEYSVLYNKNSSVFKDYANYGIALVKTGDYTKGVEMLEQAIERDPENTSCHVNLAFAYQELDKNEQALEQYQIAFKQLPNLHSIRLDYANLLADMNKNAEAVEQYNIYIKNYPTDTRAFKNLAIVYKRMNNADMAITYYEKALAQTPNDIDIKKDLASCYHARKDYSLALKYYDDILKSNPNDLDVKANKAIALHALEFYSQAIPLYEELLAVKPNSTLDANLTKALVSQGHVYLDNKDYSKAIDTFEKCITRDRENDYAYYGLAKAYRGMELNEQAGEMYEKAIALNPDKTLYSNEYGEFISTLYSQQVNVANISNDVIPEISLSYEDDNSTAQLDMVKNQDLIATGDESYRTKNFDNAIKNYQEALKINPNDEVTLLKLGNIYKDKNDNKSAMDFYKKAIIVNPEYQDGWFNLGLVYVTENNFVEAKKAFNKVIELNPEYAYAYYALAYAAEVENNKIEAVKYYKSFLQYNKDTGMVSQVQSKIRSLEK